MVDAHVKREEGVDHDWKNLSLLNVTTVFRVARLVCA